MPRDNPNHVTAVQPAAPPPHAADTLILRVVLPDGGRFAPPAAAGYHAMELMRADGVPIKAECGGAGVCATCHVRVPDDWRDRLAAPTDAELARLDDIPGADDASRLACQIVMASHLDGLALELQADSIVYHPRRIAA